ncbi:hypothetical protein BJ741DRAFT_235079 [Chytriomyces cf. hyalinus JEL632]|nr:hypothetical protein BJ741DRAFT_235079 [Chytriomyces cf. hyalinus JEL632]
MTTVKLKAVLVAVKVPMESRVLCRTPEVAETPVMYLQQIILRVKLFNVDVMMVEVAEDLPAEGRLRPHHLYRLLNRRGRPNTADLTLQMKLTAGLRREDQLLRLAESATMKPMSVDAVTVAMMVSAAVEEITMSVRVVEGAGTTTVQRVTAAKTRIVATHIVGVKRGTAATRATDGSRRALAVAPDNAVAMQVWIQWIKEEEGVNEVGNKSKKGKPLQLPQIRIPTRIQWRVDGTREETMMGKENLYEDAHLQTAAAVAVVAVAVAALEVGAVARAATAVEVEAGLPDADIQLLLFLEIVLFLFVLLCGVGFL